MTLHSLWITSLAASAMVVSAALVTRSRPEPSPFASVVVVDDDGGPGVDFLDIQPAVNAAPPKGVIRILPGLYSAFTIDNKALTLIGEAGVLIASGSSIRNLSSSRRVVLSRLSTPTLDVLDCTATVVLDQLELGESVLPATAGSAQLLFVSRSADVRIRACTIGAIATAGRAGLGIDEARVEIEQGTIEGALGDDSDPAGGDDGDPGGDGIRARTGSFVHVARSQVAGGGGGDETGFGEQGGNGGVGLRLDGASHAVVVGAGVHLLAGGSGGESRYFGTGGDGGAGARLAGGSTLLYSGVSLVPGSSDSGLDGHTVDAGPDDVNGVAAVVSPDDPSLEVLGMAIAGGAPVTFRLFGPAGAIAHVALGRQTLVDDSVSTDIGELLIPLRNFALGPIPAQGFVDLPFAAGAFPAGTFIVAQGRITISASDERRSNSAPIVVAF